MWMNMLPYAIIIATVQHNDKYQNTPQNNLKGIAHSKILKIEGPSMFQTIQHGLSLVRWSRLSKLVVYKQVRCTPVVT